MSSTLRVLFWWIFVALALAGCGGYSQDELTQQASSEATCDCPQDDVVRSLIRPCAVPLFATCDERSKFDPVTQRHYDTQMVGCVVHPGWSNHGVLCIPSCAP